MTSSTLSCLFVSKLGGGGRGVWELICKIPMLRLANGKRPRSGPPGTVHTLSLSLSLSLPLSSLMSDLASCFSILYKMLVGITAAYIYVCLYVYAKGAGPALPATHDARWRFSLFVLCSTKGRRPSYCCCCGCSCLRHACITFYLAGISKPASLRMLLRVPWPTPPSHAALAPPCFMSCTCRRNVRNQKFYQLPSTPPSFIVNTHPHTHNRTYIHTSIHTCGIRTPNKKRRVGSSFDRTSWHAPGPAVRSTHASLVQSD